MMPEAGGAGEYVVAAFYRFVPLESLRRLRSELLGGCRRAGVRGTILLAPEGLNGTLSGSRAGIDAVRAQLEGIPGVRGLRWQESRHHDHAFKRLKVKLKREIVTLGAASAAPARRTGTRVPPVRWNDLIAAPEVTVLDTRNRYETHLGRFCGAVDPRTDSFRDFKAFVRERLDPQRHRRVAMYCTGGIRCEKASAWMLEQGFEEVYQLDGGILAYLAAVDPAESRWRGECFVFDDRVSLDHALEAVEHELCPNCRMPVGPGEKALPEFEAGVCCRHCHGRTTPRRRASLAERQRQERLARGGEAREPSP